MQVSPNDVAPPIRPDPDQESVLTHDRGALLVVGAAGTGKTSVLFERFARLIEEGADPERIALVVRTGRAREAARAAILGRLRSSLPSLRVLTVHGLAHAVMNARHLALDHDEPPDVLTAADQFARVRELLQGELREDWPAYGAMLGMRGFADQVWQFLMRAQEALLGPEDVDARARAMHLTGWVELARFYRRYLNVLDDEGVVDFAGLLGQAAAAAGTAQAPLFDHLLVDDYQDATLAAERLLLGLAPQSLVVAGDPATHVFSFQGTTDVPIRRFATVFAGASRVELATRHRCERLDLSAWLAPHTSEEHAAIARELRRVHVEDGVPWGAMAVVVRRQGAQLAGILRALDDARVPRVLPERGVSLLAESATAPFVMALRWLARPEERDGLIESMLTSNLGGLSPAAARGVFREAKAAGLSPADALGLGEGLSEEERTALARLRSALAEAQTVADRSVSDAFRILWHRLPYARRLVDEGSGGLEGRRNLDAVVSLSDAIGRAGDAGPTSVADFVDALEAGEAGPGVSVLTGPAVPDAVPVYTAHDAAGDEFDTVIVAGAVEGDFPSLARPEPMFDLTVLERPVPQSERNRRRLEDERRLFRMVVGRARRRVLFTASDPHGDDAVDSARSRFVAELGVGWDPAPASPDGEPLTVREAASVWRRRLADGGSSPPARLAALDGILALGVDPSAWWFQRDWTRATPAPLHADENGQPVVPPLRVSYSRLDRLENCSLQYVLGQEVGLEGDSGYQAWVGHLVHRLIEECEDGAIERSEHALVAEAERRWQTERFPSLAVSEAFRRLVTRSILPAWFNEYGVAPAALRREADFTFPFAGAEIAGKIDRIGPVDGGGSQITDYKTGKSRNAGDPGESLQLGIYYLAVNEAEELREFLPVKAVQLAFLRDVDRSGQIKHATQSFFGRTDETEYRARIEERLDELIGRLRGLRESGIYRPNPGANCRFCDFHVLCPLWPEGRELLPPGRLESDVAPEVRT
jgi:superfamily I DNA/RNA helicase/RecB family exonuclease